MDHQAPVSQTTSANALDSALTLAKSPVMGSDCGKRGTCKQSSCVSQVFSPTAGPKCVLSGREAQKMCYRGMRFVCVCVCHRCNQAPEESTVVMESCDLMINRTVVKK